MAARDQQPPRGDDTREKIKLAAQRLFAQRGLDDVTVRDIIDAAGQKNGGSLHYYFGTKEALIKELVADGAGLVNAERTRRLEEIEARGGPASLREILRLLADPLAGGIGDGFEPDYIAFINRLAVEHYDLLMEAMEAGRRDSSYRRALEYIRRFLPDLPRRLFDQRIKLMTLYVVAALSSRRGPMATGPSCGMIRPPRKTCSTRSRACWASRPRPKPSAWCAAARPADQPAVAQGWARRWRSVEAGWRASIAAGRIGRATRLPAQLGQVPWKTPSAQSAQKVHS
ncbi:TetR/AcrR family transcriptional regulator [Oleomonas cavernae]|uniref:TetR/AcrR family transcriptional regulator n=1 Tax=Oleomonas cavernae TaxID=2320859 RepID=A0A418VTQ3_9PROT|nr:TetR/AcrR family transcriptional regulator [Oleomonas cavernae]